MDVQKVTAEYRLNHWSNIIKECRSSGQTARAWCKEHDVNEKAYYYWLRRIRAAACHLIPELNNKEPRIVPMKTNHEIQPVFEELKVPFDKSSELALILHVNGAVLEIQNRASQSVIENTLKVLKSLC